MNMRKLLLAIASVLLIEAVSLANSNGVVKNQEKLNNTTLAETSQKDNSIATKSANASYTKTQSEKLRCMLFLSQQSPSQDWWYKIPRNSAPQIGHVRKLVIGQDFSLFPFVENAAIKDGMFKVTYSIYLIAPDGKRTTYVDNAVFSGKKATVAAVQACPDILSGTVSEQNFSVGKYRFEMFLRDDIDGQTAEAETWFDIVKWTEPLAMTDGKILNDYIKNYYLQPSPETLWSIFFSDQLNLAQKNAPNGLNYIFIGFLRAAFTQNSFLLAKIDEKFASANSLNRAKIIFLKAILNEQPIDDSKLRDYERKYQTSIRKAIPKDPHKAWDPLMGTAQLDMLWGEFYADGTYAPIRRIIDALSFSNQAQAAERMIDKKQKPQTPLEWDDMFFGMLYQGALITLVQNSYDIDLVKKYCLFAIEHGDIPSKAIAQFAPLIKGETNVIDDAKQNTEKRLSDKNGSEK